MQSRTQFVPVARTRRGGAMVHRALKWPGGALRRALLDLLVVWVVLALLLVAAAPSIGAWGADAHIRSTADALQGGLQLAQREAMRGDRHSAFVLTLAAPALGAKPVADGANWYVLALQASGSDERDAASEVGAAAKEHFVGGGRFAWPSVSVAGPAVLCFDPIGRLTGFAAGANRLDVPCAPTDPVAYVVSSSTDGTQPLWVHVNPEGQVQVCRKARTPRTGDTDDC